jgi:hypothetical protein
MKKWPHKRGGLSWGGQLSSCLLSQCIWYMALYEGCLINIQLMHTFLNHQMCFFTSHSLFSIRCWIFVDEGKSVAIECNINYEKKYCPPFWERINEDDETNILTIREDKKDKYLGLRSGPPYYLRILNEWKKSYFINILWNFIKSVMIFKYLVPC